MKDRYTCWVDFHYKSSGVDILTYYSKT